MKAPPKKAGSKTKSRILIVDAHPMMREGLAQLISRQPGLVVCGEAATAPQAVELVKKLQPDLVLADITLPGRNGIELIKDIQAVVSGMAVLVISMHDEAIYAERVLRAGGRGYIMKQEGGEKLMQAIRQVLSGQIFVSETISARILELFSGHGAHLSKTPLERLTDREFEVFQLVGRGLGRREIAQELHMSVRTAEVHRANIKKKLEHKSSSELIRFAVRWAEGQTISGDRAVPPLIRKQT
jgi:DNA-binding NarL/FixJ family response regulator